MATVLRRDITISEGDYDELAIDCQDYLDATETVSNASAVELTTSDLTIGSAGALAVTDETKVVLERLVRAGAVVFGDVIGQKRKNSPYLIRVTINTSGGRRRIVDCEFEVE